MPSFQEDFTKAKEFHNANNFAEAIKLYEKLINQDDSNSDLLYHMGLAFLQSGGQKQSIPYFQRAAGLDPDNGLIPLHLGIAYCQLKEFENAIRFLQSALQRNDDLHQAHLWLSRSLSELGKIDEAYSILLNLSKKTPAFTEQFPQWVAELFIRVCYLSAVAPESLRKAFLTKATQLCAVLSQNKSTIYKLFGHHHAGLLLKLSGDLEGARKHFEFANRIAPDFEQAEFYYRLLNEHLIKEKKVSHKNERPKLCVHIGYPKAGSTWLQRSIFPNLRGINHLGLTFYDIIDRDGTGLAHYGYPTLVNNPSFPLRAKSYAQEDFLSYLKRNIRNDVYTNTISDEALLLIQPDELIKRLQVISERLDVDLKVIIVIRKQSNIVVSEYGQGFRVNKWPGKRLDSLLEWDSFTDQSQSMSLGNYDYYSIIKQFVSGLGETNVLIMPFEKMFCFEALSEIIDFMGVKASNDYINLLHKSPGINAMPSVVKENILKLNPNLDNLKQEIDDYFMASNEALDKTYNLGLKEFGYY